MFNVGEQCDVSSYIGVSEINSMVLNANIFIHIHSVSLQNI